MLFSSLPNGIQEVNFILTNVFCYIGCLILAIQVHNPLNYVLQCCEKQRGMLCARKQIPENTKSVAIHMTKRNNNAFVQLESLRIVFFHTSLTKCIK